MRLFHFCTTMIGITSRSHSYPPPSQVSHSQDACASQLKNIVTDLTKCRYILDKETNLVKQQGVDAIFYDISLLNTT